MRPKLVSSSTMCSKPMLSPRPPRHLPPSTQRRGDSWSTRCSGWRWSASAQASRPWGPRAACRVPHVTQPPGRPQGSHSLVFSLEPPAPRLCSSSTGRPEARGGGRLSEDEALEPPSLYPPQPCGAGRPVSSREGWVSLEAPGPGGDLPTHCPLAATVWVAIGHACDSTRMDWPGARAK